MNKQLIKSELRSLNMAYGQSYEDIMTVLQELISEKNLRGKNNKEGENLNKTETSALNITEVIGSASFQKSIKDAIEYGKGIDYGYDGEDEFAINTFDSDESLQEVIRVLRAHLF